MRGFMVMLILMIVSAVSFGYVEQNQDVYFNDLLVRGDLTAPFTTTVFKTLTITDGLTVDSIEVTGDLTVLGDTNVVITGYFKGDSLDLAGGATIGGTLVVTGISDFVGALTSESYTSDAAIIAGTTLASGTTIIAGSSLEATTTLDVGTNAIIDGTMTSATYNFASSTVVAGTADAITMDFTPDFPTLTAGSMVIFVAEAANTGAATLDIDGVGAVAIVECSDGSALEAGDIANAMLVMLIHDGTSFVQVSQSGN